MQVNKTSRMDFAKNIPCQINEENKCEKQWKAEKLKSLVGVDR